jgi:hypothetical protein
MIAPRLMGIVVALAFWVSVTGCTQQQPGASRAGASPSDPQVAAGPQATKREALVATSFAATVKGRVTYNGDLPAPMEIKNVDKPNQAKGCPPNVMKAGWYVGKSSDGKGVRYAVVFLRAPGGMKMPRLSDEQLKAPEGKKIVEISQPKCQFEPRVLVLGPDQDLKVVNNSDPPQQHDANLHGPATYNKALPAGHSFIYKNIDASDVMPYGVYCPTHSAFMNAYVWKFKHPFAAVTDDDGQFEIKNCPVPINGKLELWVWHEMLDVPGNRKLVRALELNHAGIEEVNFSIPR